MEDRDQFEGPDKVAAIFLGTPALLGVILVTMAFSLEGSAPFRDRMTTVPVGIALLAAGGMGGTIYLRWRARKKKRLELEKLARSGAILLRSQQRTERMIRISYALADEFLLGAG